MKLFKSRKAGAEEIDLKNLPRHIAVIMDGNGRWAKKRNLPRTAGHAVGVETFRKIATCCKELGVEYLTVYAFSTENWKRPGDEVSTIMGLLEKYMKEAIRDAEKNQVRMRFLGDLSGLSPSLRDLARETERATRSGTCQVNICINYGGRAELLRAAQRYARDFAEGKAEVFTEADLNAYLYTAGMPDPDLIIRPSGEKRLSNFLLWQSAYAEFYFTDTLWPDFDERQLRLAIADYQKRGRRFGGVK